MIMPSLTALFPNSFMKKVCNEGPIFRIIFLNKLNELLIFFRSPISFNVWCFLEGFFVNFLMKRGKVLWKTVILLELFFWVDLNGRKRGGCLSIGSKILLLVFIVICDVILRTLKVHVLILNHSHFKL